MPTSKKTPPHVSDRLIFGLAILLICLSIIPVLRDISSARQDVTGLFDQCLAIAACVLFLLLVRLARRSPENGAVVPSATRDWLIAYAAVLLVSASLILVADPYSRFGPRPFSRLILPTSRKIEAYNRLPDAPQVVVLGSSRALPIQSSYFEGKWGIDTFNFSVQGTSTETLLILTRYMLAQNKFPHVLFVEVSPPLDRGEGAVLERTPPSLLPFTSADLVLPILRQDFFSILSIQSLSDAFYILLRYFWTGVPEYEAYFDESGDYIDPNLDSGIQPDTLAAEALNMRLSDCSTLDPIGIREIEELMRIAAGQDSSVVFFQSPRSRDLYDRMIAEDPFSACLRDFSRTMRAFDTAYSNVFFLDYIQLETVESLAASAYRDPIHLTYSGAQALIDAAIPTIQDALAQARSMQNAP
jgi:hypothetical protein